MLRSSIRHPATNAKLLSRPRAVAAAALVVASLVASVFGGEAADALQRGRVLLQKSDFPGAIAAFGEAIRLDPKLGEAYLMRGWCYTAQEEFDKAVADYGQAIKLDAKNAAAWCNRGHAIAKGGDLDRALPDLNEALRLDPKMVPAYLARGWIYSEKSAFDKAVADYTEALRLSPDDPQAHVDRATCLSGLTKYGEAIADLDAAIKLSPEEARFYGARGAAHVLHGDYREGAADLQKAIRLNPDDAGAKYQPSSDVKLSPEALRHGQEQVRRMMQDRPALGQYGEETAFLRQWAARKFAGEDFGEPFDWDPTLPRDSDAENVGPVGGRRGLIRVELVHSFGPRRGITRTFEELWAPAAFELHNITYSRHFVRLHQEAAQGKLTKEAFVAAIWKYEYLAAQRTRAFYATVFLPWAEKKKLPTDPGLWFASWWESAADALEGFDKSSYPWRPYSRQYDWAIVQLLYRQQDHGKALKLLEQMRTEKVYTQDNADIYLWMGRCQSAQRKPALAVEAFTKAIGLNPKRADAYQLRGGAYEAIGEKTKAAADHAKAKQLGDGRE